MGNVGTDCSPEDVQHVETRRWGQILIIFYDILYYILHCVGFSAVNVMSTASKVTSKQITVFRNMTPYHITEDQSSSRTLRKTPIYTASEQKLQSYQMIRFVKYEALKKKIIPWNRFLRDKLSCPQLVMKPHAPNIMKPEGSLPHSQKPTTCSCPETDQSSPWLRIPRV